MTFGVKAGLLTWLSSAHIDLVTSRRWVLEMPASPRPPLRITPPHYGDLSTAMRGLGNFKGHCGTFKCDSTSVPTNHQGNKVLSLNQGEGLVLQYRKGLFAEANGGRDFHC